MTELATKDVFREAAQRRIAICEEIRRVKDVTPQTSLGVDLLKNYTDVPEALVLWGEKLIKHGYLDIGLQFIQVAVKNAYHDKRPRLIYVKSCRVLDFHGLHAEAQDIRLKEINGGYSDPKGYDIAARYFIHDHKPQEAIALLRPLYDRGESDMFLINTLAKAYTYSGQPEEAVKILAPLHEKKMGNDHTCETLANAYVLSKNLAGFQSIKDNIHSLDLRAYMEAKLHYFLGHPEKSLKCLKSRMENSPKPYIAGLFMASLENDNPLHQIFKKTLGSDGYALLIKCRDQWLENPLSVERGNNPLRLDTRSAQQHSETEAPALSV
jgi:hypothetical protein